MKWKIPEKFLKKDKLILIILVGILLLVIKLPTKNEKKNENVVQTATTEKISTDYASKLEGRLEKLFDLKRKDKKSKKNPFARKEKN